MRKLSLFLLVTLAGVAQAQLPEGKTVWLEWSNLRVAMAPQSVGTFLWVQKSGGAQGPQAVATFYDNVLPNDVKAWLERAKPFVTDRLTAADTGNSRTSTILNTRSGAAYLVRRKVNGDWSPERFLILQASEGSPIAINMDEATTVEVLDSLGAVALRTRYSAESFVREARESANSTPGVTPPVELADSPDPAYSGVDQMAKIEGSVLVSFIVDQRGKADIQSVKVIHSAAPTLLGSVLAVLPDLKFSPATLNGSPVRYRVVLPYTFALKK